MADPVEYEHGSHGAWLDPEPAPEAAQAQPTEQVQPGMWMHPRWREQPAPEADDREALAEHIYGQWRKAHPGRLTWATEAESRRDEMRQMADWSLSFRRSQPAPRTVVAHVLLETAHGEAAAEFLEGEAATPWLNALRQADAVLEVLEVPRG